MADSLRPMTAPPPIASGAQIARGGHTCERCGQVIAPGDREAMPTGSAGWVHLVPCLLPGRAA